VFEELQGVVDVESGYAGGHLDNPTYRQVCDGITGHAEVVRIEFDPKVISYREILEVFFAIHDPTTLNRQGADVGTQYRSEIFATTPEQSDIARDTIGRLNGSGEFDAPIVTAVSDAGPFYKAEEYHEDYFNKNPGQGYCRAVIGPKVAKFRKKFVDRLKETSRASSPAPAPRSS
jgi:peptide-methionine (S)-S-oxide reductase